MTKKALVVSGSNVLTFDTGYNIWKTTVLTPGALVPQNFTDYGFDPALLITSLSAVYVKFIDNGVLGDGELYLTEDIDKSVQFTTMEYLDSDTEPKVKINLATPFLPKDSLSPTDVVLYYNDDTTYKPEIISTTFSATSTHNDSITLTSNIIYNFNANVKYRIKVGNIYISDWSTEQSAQNPIMSIIYPQSLQLGPNDITIEVKDSTDDTKLTTSTLSGAITLSNTAPNVNIITADSDNFKIHFIITDPDMGDTVDYKLSLITTKGTTLISDWNEYNTTADVTYQFDSSLLDIDKTNTLKIEYRDNYGTTSSTNYEFTGQYKNILFVDENGEYYVSDKGNVLKILHFGKVMSGRISSVKKVTIKNNNTYPINGIQLSCENTNPLAENIYMELSKTLNPFDPLSGGLDYGDLVLNTGETLDFYVRIRSEGISVSGINNFEISVFALPLVD